MIAGIGIDMVKIEKMKNAIQRWGGAFINRVFNSQELEDLSGKIYYQRLAARFAAKEAVIKAISKHCSLALKDILILNKSNGAPFCKFKKDIGFDLLISLKIGRASCRERV